MFKKRPIKGLFNSIWLRWLEMIQWDKSGNSGTKSLIAGQIQIILDYGFDAFSIIRTILFSR